MTPTIMERLQAEEVLRRSGNSLMTMLEALRIAREENLNRALNAIHDAALRTRG